MARVRLNETQDLPEEHRWLFERLEAQGPMLNIFRAMSHSPVALRRFMKFGSYFLGEGKLDPKLRELAILRAGYLCRSPYEFSQHIAFGRRVGLSDSQIRGIAEPNVALFDPQQMAVLAYAGELTSDARVSDATYERRRRIPQRRRDRRADDGDRLLQHGLAARSTRSKLTSTRLRSRISPRSASNL